MGGNPMRYFKHKTSGDVYAVDDGQDWIITADMVELSQAEIDNHLNPPPYVPTAAEQLAATDAGFIRVVEDLVNTLITKGVIQLAELPQAAQDKITTRHNLRAQL